MTHAELIEFLKANPPAAEFTPYIFESNGAISAVFAPDPDYSEVLSDQITLYRSLETKQIVGCRLTGFRSLVETP